MSNSGISIARTANVCLTSWKRIFKLFLQHGSAKKVAAQLQSEGIERFPGTEGHSHGKIVKGRQQPLITRDLWDKVNGMLKVSANQPAKRR